MLQKKFQLHLMFIDYNSAPRNVCMPAVTKKYQTFKRWEFLKYQEAWTDGGDGDSTRTDRRKHAERPWWILAVAA